MKHSIDTGLDFATSKTVLEKAMGQYMERFKDYNPKFSWKNDKEGDFGFSAKGISLGGKVTLHDSRIEIDMDVPFLLKPFQSKAMNVIEEQVRKWVGKAKAGEL